MQVTSDFRNKPLAFSPNLSSSLRSSPGPSSSSLAPAAVDPRASVHSNGLVRASLEGGTIDILAHYDYADDYAADGELAQSVELDEGDDWARELDPSPVQPNFAQHQPIASTSTGSSSVVSPTINVISASNSFLDFDAEDEERRESLAPLPREANAGGLNRNNSTRTQDSGKIGGTMRESTMSAMTTGSMDTMDPFQYDRSGYQGAASPTERNFSQQHKHSNSLSPIVELSARSRTPSPTQQLAQAPPATPPPKQALPSPPPTSRTPPQATASAVKFVDPNPTQRAQLPPRTSSSPRSPQPTTTNASPINRPTAVGLGLNVSPASSSTPPLSQIAEASQATYVAQPAAVAVATSPSTGRAPSRAPLAKNYSRPMFPRPFNTVTPPPPSAIPNQQSPTAGPSARERERELSAGSSNTSSPPPTASLPSRSDSLDSVNGQGQTLSSVGHGSATSASHAGGGASSQGHASSYGAASSQQSHGATSLSPSWEERQHFQLRTQPSFDRLPLDHGPPRPAPAPPGSSSASSSHGGAPGSTHAHEMKSDLSPAVSDAYGALYPGGSPSTPYSPAPSSATTMSPSLEPPPPMSRGVSATSSSGASSGAGSSRSTSQGRNVLKKPRPQNAPQPPNFPPRAGRSSTEKEGAPGWRGFRSKKDAPRSPPQPSTQLIGQPELKSSSVDPRASFMSHATQMSYVPPTNKDWGISPEVARQRAQERSLQEQMRLQPGVGRTAGAAFVHRGEEGVSPQWLALEAGAGGVGGTPSAEDDEVERLEPFRMRLSPGAAPSPGSPYSHRSREPSNASSGGEDGGGRAGSVYSDYSYYGVPGSELNSRQPSPLASHSQMSFQQQQSSATARKGQQRQSTTLEKTKLGLSAGRTAAEAATPEEYLALGIEHHENGELELSAWCLEQSAKRAGGCPAGFLIYGLTLRHGWGCQMQPELGFAHLQKAAEMVLPSLAPAFQQAAAGGKRTKTSSLVLASLPAPEQLPDLSAQKAAKTALTLALYEMGVSLRFGWGVAKDKKVALEYFKLSAALGDVDAAQEAAFMLLNGKGCKKNKKEAARLYRLAIDRGAPSFGLSWVYKTKYMDD